MKYKVPISLIGHFIVDGDSDEEATRVVNEIMETLKFPSDWPHSDKYDSVDLIKSIGRPFVRRLDGWEMT